MFGFACGEDGDLSMTDGRINEAEDAELMRETLRAVWSTNQGEWDGDPEEGIIFSNFLGKDPDEEEMRAELETALEKVSDTATITSFEVEKDRASRTMKIQVGVRDGDEETVVEL